MSWEAAHAGFRSSVACDGAGDADAAAADAAAAVVVAEVGGVAAA